MPETEEKDTEFISQDDIDALLSHPEEEEIEEVDLDDLQKQKEESSAK